jgi:hypothetical protein
VAATTTRRRTSARRWRDTAVQSFAIDARKRAVPVPVGAGGIQAAGSKSSKQQGHFLICGEMDDDYKIRLDLYETNSE